MRLNFDLAMRPEIIYTEIIRVVPTENRSTYW